jgi:Taurine catabolism dioxygenase TauD, TfdA family
MHDQQIAHPAAWLGPDISGKEGLSRHLTDEEIVAIWDLVACTSSQPTEMITREAFANPVVDRLMECVRYDLMNGRGAVVLTGLDLSGRPVNDFARVFWGLATHIGSVAVQNEAGERICSVRNDRSNPTGRGYLRNIELRPHTDFHEVLGLAAFESASAGGETGLCSSLSIHNYVLSTNPEHLPPLYEGFYQLIPGTDDVTRNKAPLFCNIEGAVSLFFHDFFFEEAASHLDIPLPPDLVAAQDFVCDVASQEGVGTEFLLERGEILFWHNLTLLHSRRAFRDDASRQRLLLRVWIHVKEGRPMHRSFVERAMNIDRVHQSGRAAINYNMRRST